MPQNSPALSYKSGPACGIDPTAPGGIRALLDFHRATFGDARMDGTETGTTERPEGVSEEEWSALGDPGKAALTRERERATKAERDLAAARAPKPAPPAATTATTTTTATTDNGGADKGAGKGGDAPDLAALISHAVTAAVTPLKQELDGWKADQAAGRIRGAVTEAAAPRFYDTTDALARVDLASLTDGNGSPDAAKIAAALDALATASPHLVKPFDMSRRAAPGTPLGATSPGASSMDDQVKAALTKMQQTLGVKFAPQA